jgi:hypothetical protein
LIVQIFIWSKIEMIAVIYYGKCFYPLSGELLMKRLSFLISLFCFVGIVSAQNAPLNDGAQLLMWIAPNAGGNSRVVLYDGANTPTILLDETGITGVVQCGEGTSPNGTYTMFQTVGGLNIGNLYLLTGTDSNIVTLEQGLNVVGCMSDNAQFSPNSEQLAYLSYPDGSERLASPFGRLLIKNTADQTIVGNYENIAAFDMTDFGLVAVGFFPNDDGEATEVALFRLEGNSLQEVSTLTSDIDNDCYYNNAAIRSLGNRMLAVLGYRCNRGDNRATQYQVYSVDVPARTATQILSGNTAGGYFPFTRSNSVYGNGNNAIFTVPDGLTNNTVSVYSTDIVNPSVNVVAERFAVMPGVSASTNNAPVISNDGRYLAFVTNDGNAKAALYVTDLTNLSLPPVVIEVGDRGDSVNEMIMTPDSRRLFYVSGVADSGNNSTFLLDLTTGTSNRLARGRFGNGVMNADGSQVALLSYVTVDDEPNPYQTIVVMNVNDGAQTTIYEGAQVVEGEIQNSETLRLVAWRSR